MELDPDLAKFKKRGTIAAISLFPGLIVVLFSSDMNYLPGLVLMAPGFFYVMYQALFQRELAARNRAYERQRRIEKRNGTSNLERDVKRIKFILTCMAASIGFGILALAFLMFTSQ